MTERWRELQQTSLLKDAPLIFVAIFISKLHKTQLLIKQKHTQWSGSFLELVKLSFIGLWVELEKLQKQS